MIAPSELILDDQGHIYHIKIKPGELAKKILLVGDPQRVDKILKYFSSVEFTRQHREFYIATGEYKNRRVSVVGTGIGVPNIDIVINEIDAVFNIDFHTKEPKRKNVSLELLRLGTSGSLQSDVPAGALVFSQETIGFDAVGNFYVAEVKNREWHKAFREFVKMHFEKFPPYYFAPSSEHWNISANVLRGITLTSPGFYASQGRILRYALQFPGFPKKLEKFEYEGLRCINMEMEASLINLLGKMLGHKTGTLCVTLANRQKGEFIEDYDKAIENLIQTGLEIIINS